MLAILSSDDWLGKGSLEEPALLHPGWLESRVQAFEMGQELGQQFLFAHAKNGIVHSPVIPQVDQVTTAVLAGGSIVRMLDQAGKGIAGIDWIDPVAIGQLAIQRKDHALRAVGLAPVVAGLVVVWE